MDEKTEQMFLNAKSMVGDDEELIQLSNLAGFQVSKGELFSHVREPAITIWGTRIKFNMACLRRFPEVQLHCR